MDGCRLVDIRKHPCGLVLHRFSGGGHDRRAILTKPFDGPYMAALVLGLSPEKNAGFRPTSNGRIVDHSKVQLRNDN